MFVGYALDYSLHIAHKYGCEEAVAQELSEALQELPDHKARKLGPKRALRLLRVTYAMKSIGGAALGSAMTTLGASAFLLLCTLTIFGKIGIVVLAISFLSIFTALVPLAATLMLVGPVNMENTFLRNPRAYLRRLRQRTARWRLMHKLSQKSGTVVARGAPETRGLVGLPPPPPASTGKGATRSRSPSAP